MEILKLRKDLEVGSKYGKLTILENIYHEKGTRSQVRVRCDCGREYIARKSPVKTGQITRCKYCRESNKRKKNIGEMSGHFWAMIISNARKRNINFELNKIDTYNLFLEQDKKCKLSDLPIQFSNYGEKEQTASLDRIDSSRSYTINNVQWVHKNVNRIKQNLTQERFLELCKLITNKCG